MTAAPPLTCQPSPASPLLPALTCHHTAAAASHSPTARGPRELRRAKDEELAEALSTKEDDRKRLETALKQLARAQDVNSDSVTQGRNLEERLEIAEATVAVRTKELREAREYGTDMAAKRKVEKVKLDALQKGVLESTTAFLLIGSYDEPVRMQLCASYAHGAMHMQLCARATIHIEP